MSDVKAYQRWFSLAQRRGLFKKGGGVEQYAGRFGDLLFPSSLQHIDGVLLCLIRCGGRRCIAIFSDDAMGFTGHHVHSGADHVWFCALNHENAVHLRRQLLFTAPSSLSRRTASFGVGDRLGIATPGHIRILRRFMISPVLAQQSPRELELAGRSYKDIIDPATWAVFQEGFAEPWGADGDHLKSVQWVREARSLGCTMITADLTDHIQSDPAKLHGNALKEEYEKLSPAYRRQIEGEYIGQHVTLDTGERIEFSRETLARISVTYTHAVLHAQTLFNAGSEFKGAFDFEVSIDETDTPTSAEAHVFVARELEKLRVPLLSLAPRFIGTFEKAIDYSGDLAAFKRSFSTHSAIARRFGHKLSIHSGSDKFSIYPLIGELTDATYHIKTCGTSWLEALALVAEINPALFRELYRYAKTSLPIASRYYKTVASPEQMIDDQSLQDRELLSLIQRRDERQLLHITYGQILSNRLLKQKLLELLHSNIELYWERLESHIGKHLHSLGVSKR